LIGAAGSVVRRLDAVAYFTLVLAVFTGVQVWAFVKSERGFVTVEIADQKSKLEPTGQLRMVLSINNGGKSTVVLDDSLAYGTLTPGNLSIDPDYSTESPIVSGPIVPGQSRFSMEIPTYTYGPNKGKFVAFDQKVIDGINAHQATYFIYGYVRYEDDFSIFGGVWALGYRETAFCYAYDPGNLPQFGMWNVCSNRHYVYAH
jgi:hypothetical protein